MSMEPEVEVMIPQEALEGVDLSIPAEYELEIMAGELVSHLTSYHTAAKTQKAARQQENHQQAEAQGKIVAISRSAIALIQHEHPEAKAIADTIMVAQAQNIKRVRVRSGNGVA